MMNCQAVNQTNLLKNHLECKIPIQKSSVLRIVLTFILQQLKSHNDYRNNLKKNHTKFAELMNKHPVYLLIICLSLIFSSCMHEDFDDKIRDASLFDSQNFVYEGLKQFYLYKSNKEVLAD